MNLNTNNAGAHTHTYEYHNTNNSIDDDEYPNGAIRPNITTGNTGSAGGHVHAVSGNTGAPSTNTTDTLGESATDKNLPPYYALTFIIKT